MGTNFAPIANAMGGPNIKPLASIPKHVKNVRTIQVIQLLYEKIKKCHYYSNRENKLNNFHFSKFFFLFHPAKRILTTFANCTSLQSGHFYYWVYLLSVH